MWFGGLCRRYAFHISTIKRYYIAVIVERKGDTRTQLLEAAADMIAASPGKDVPLRAICDRVGVKLPTLYHFFGSKEGLLDAVIERGFDLYLGQKSAQISSGDPIADMRAGWDAHVKFGLENPGFYTLMYGQIAPGAVPAAQNRATEMLRAVVRVADTQGRLVVDPDLAVSQILASNIGVTLALILTGRSDYLELSESTREATLAWITGVGRGGVAASADASEVAGASEQLLNALGSEGSPLGEPETVLLKKWLGELGRS